ncbi:hypothetical protein FACS1894191_0440 [Clostridia bacterium]|nr:hypothetical protein FACS1894191_0440 [Clostridia bacterium]
MKTYIETIKMACAEKLNGGIPALMLGYLLKTVTLLPLLLLWRAFAADGADLGGFTLAQLLAYTCVSTMLSQQLNVQSQASSWHYEGGIIDLYRRPQGVFGQLAAHTIGGWLPMLLLFSLPAGILLFFLGVDILPASPWFFPSFLLGISLGFAVDFLFACFIIRMQNASWLAYVIRGAITSLLSGALIPFDLLPWRLGEVFKLLPFGSLAGGPLAVFVGTGAPASIIPLQAFWNLTLWPLAALAFQSSRERMVSYGG